MAWELVDACKEGKLELTKYLVRTGINIHFRDNSALRAAGEFGHLEIVKFLVENGADIHARNDCTLKLASICNHFELIKYLAGKGADINAICGQRCWRYLE